MIVIEYNVLGPLAANTSRGPVPLGPPRHQKILALLVLNADQVVSLSKLIDVLWGDRPPATAREQVQNGVSALRRTLLASVDGALEPMTSLFSGVVLNGAGARFDVRAVEDLTTMARAAGDARQAADHLRAALALWRGPSLAGLTGPFFESAAAHLDERRLAIVEECLDRELDSRPAHQLVPELQALVADHRLRERLVGQLMIALYRSGRQADALAEFRMVRARLREELGIEPGHQLVALERAILRLDPQLDAVGEATTPAPRLVPVPAPAPVASAQAGPVRRAVPRQIPRTMRTIVGRDDQLSVIGRILAPANLSAESPVVCCHGGGGIGKSALVLRAAHAAAADFPDGQLYANLRGAGAGLTQLTPLELLGRFLRALDVPGDEIPTGLDEAAAKWRTLLADRRVLLVLDNAASAAQIRPILPATAGSAVLVTSRPMLASLDDATHIDVPLLAPEPAKDLLTALAGVSVADAHAHELAELCGRLPLALRIAGARLSLNPLGGANALIDDLRDERRRLTGLAVDDLALRTTFLPVYRQAQAQAPAAVRMFRLLAVARIDEIGLPAAAALIGTDVETAGDALRYLVEARLLESPAPQRFQMHDLLRLFALERLDIDATGRERADAWSRLVEHYRHAIYLGGQLERSTPGHANSMPAAGTLPTDVTFDSRDAAVAWLETERRAVMAIAEHASTLNDDTSTFAEDVRRYMTGFLSSGNYLDDILTVSRWGLDTAERLGRWSAAAFCASGLGFTLFRRGLFVDARVTAERGIALAERAGDRVKEANCRFVHSLALLRLGHYDESAVAFEIGMRICQDLGTPHQQAVALHNRAESLLDLDRVPEAVELLTRSLEIRAEFDDPIGWLLGHVSLGKAQYLLGDSSAAEVTLGRALGLSIELGNRPQQSQILIVLAKIAVVRGSLPAAQEHAENSRVIAHAMGDLFVEALAMKLIAAVHAASGRSVAAERSRDEADAILRDDATAVNVSLERIVDLGR